MTARMPPSRHWRSYNDDPLPLPLPTGAEAPAEPLAAFPSWLAGLLLATVLGLCATPEASADTGIIIGAGLDSCGIWTAERRDRSFTAGHYTQWVVGYLSGAASWGHDLDPMKGLDAQAVWSWMDNYCQEHPLATIVEAATAFVKEHPGK